MGVNAAACILTLLRWNIVWETDGQAVGSIPPSSALNTSNSASLHVQEVHPKDAPFALSGPRKLLSVTPAWQRLALQGDWQFAVSH